MKKEVEKNITFKGYEMVKANWEKETHEFLQNKLNLNVSVMELKSIKINKGILLIVTLSTVEDKYKV